MSGRGDDAGRQRLAGLRRVVGQHAGGRIDHERHVFIDAVGIGARSTKRVLVLVPGDLVVIAGRGEDVEVAVAVHVRRKHAVGPVRGGGDGVGGEVLAAVVLVPGDLVVIVRRGEDVDVAVAVHVRRKHAAGPVRRRC